MGFTGTILPVDSGVKAADFYQEALDHVAQQAYGKANIEVDAYESLYRQLSNELAVYFYISKKKLKVILEHDVH